MYIKLNNFGFEEVKKKLPEQKKIEKINLKLNKIESLSKV